jgi:hypothetical protein
MIITTAASVLDLRMSAPYWVDQRAALCSPRLEHFDAVSGLLQFFTYCANSRNQWIQTIVYENWESVVNIEPSEYAQPPGEGEEPGELIAPEVELEENTIKSDDSWEIVRGKVPELINLDIKVHCNCPAFLWWGSQYNLEQRDTALYPEGAPPPTSTDPYLANVICKHLAAVFDRYF